VKKILFLIFGFLFLAIGSIGLILPILPGTPFFLLSAFFFINSSEKVYKWLLTLPVIGKVVLDWQKHKSINMKTKRWSTFYLWVTLIYSMYFLYPKIPLIILLLTIGLSVSIFIWTRPSRHT